MATRGELLDALEDLVGAVGAHARAYPFWRPLPALSAAWERASAVVRLGRDDGPHKPAERKTMASATPQAAEPPARRRRSHGPGVEFDRVAFRAARQLAGLTGGQIALRAGVTRCHVYQLERGRGRPSAEVRDALWAAVRRGR